MGVYPERLKYAIINPIHKKGDKALISNYRPICLVTGFAKVFETVIFRRLNDHIETHKILLPEQFGFRSGLSTEDAIYKLTNVILRAWNSKEYVTGIFCDIAKAFDCINHELLLMKLQYYGVQGVLLEWFKSYLQHRRQRVELKYTNDKYYSDWDIVRCGVPQGSVLGPLLFNVYINDFPFEINKISEVMFADDTSILCTTKDYHNLKIKLEVIFSHMFKWFQDNQFVLNLDKTKMIKFTSTAATCYPLNLMFHDKTLKEAETIKFLGLQLDNHLTCKGHTDFLLHKLSIVCFLMRKLYYILNINGLKTVYYTYCHSLVKYGIIYWGNTSNSNKVFVLENKIIRIMMGVGPTHTCRGLFKKLSILPIPCVYLFSLMMFVVNNFDKFQTNNSVHGVNTRNNEHLHRPITHLSSYQRGVYYSGVTLFNSLPINITTVKNDKNQFRVALRSYLQNHSFYSIDEFIEQTKNPNVKSV
jgi:hypothetical protein